MAVAAVSKHFFAKVMVNLMVKLSAGSYPIRLFGKAEDAHRWLAAFDGVQDLTGWYELQEQVEAGTLREVHRVGPLIILEDPLSDTLAVQTASDGVTLEQTREVLGWAQERSKERRRRLSFIILSARMGNISRASSRSLGEQPWLAHLIIVQRSSAERLLTHVVKKIFRPEFEITGVGSPTEALHLARRGIPKKTEPIPESAHSGLAPLIETLLAYARGDYTQRAPEGSLDGEQTRFLASAINALGEELAHTVATREALNKKQEFLESILNSLPIGVSIKDLRDDHRTRFWNHAAAKIMGLPVDKVVGARVHDLIPKGEADRVYESEKQAARSTEPVKDSLQISREGSEEVTHVETQKSLIRLKGDPDPGLLLTVYEDITPKKRAAEKLEAARVAAFHSSQLAVLGEMSAGIAHEINNPLTIISGKAKLIKLAAGQPTPDLRQIGEQAEVILETVQRIGKVIDGLRAASRRGDGDPRQPTAVETLFERSLTLCNERLRSQNVRIETEVMNGANQVLCRETEILQVLINLITNACDAQSGSPAPWIRLRSSQTQAGHVQISVSDGGAGVPESLRQRVFEPFFTTKPVGQGTGLGLAVCQNILSKHEGKLWIDPQAPHTCFVMELPAPQSTRKTA